MNGKVYQLVVGIDRPTSFVCGCCCDLALPLALLGELDVLLHLRLYAILPMREDWQR